MSPARNESASIADPTSRVARLREREVTYWVDERQGRFPWPWWKVAGAALVASAFVIGVLTLIWVDRIQDQAADDARRALVEAGVDISGLTFDADYRNLTITGEVAPTEDTGRLQALAENPESVRQADIRVTSRPEPEPVSEPEPESESEPEPEPEPEAELGSTLVTAEVGPDGAIVLRGTVLTESQRTALIAAAEAAAGDAGVIDELVVSGLAAAVDGADDRVVALGALLEGLPEHASGTATLSDTELVFEGFVARSDDVDVVDQLTSGLAGVTSRADVAVDDSILGGEIDELQAQFDALAVEIQETVTFETGSAELAPTATATLDKAVALMARYTLPVVEISGHTDDRGDDQSNLDLSAARAAAVAAYLVDAGVSPERIQSRGAGEAEPVADNSTPEGRAENRRVQLDALASFS